MQVRVKLPLFLFVPLALFTVNCSSTLKIEQQVYAKLPQEKFFEYSFPEVWKAIEESLKDLKVVSRDPEDVKERSLKTDWIYAQSRDKFHVYTTANNLPPKRIYLQTRVKYQLTATQAVGGVRVRVHIQEEIKSLKKDGSPSEAYQSSDSIDTSLGNEILEKIQLKLLANG